MNLILHQIKSSKLNFLESSSGEYAPPTQIVLLPKSPIVGRDGREFHYNTQEVIDAFIENQAKLPIDIEHATEINAPKGIYSPALGWVASVQAGIEGEVVANVQWNSNSPFELSYKSYKYYSPAFEVDDNDHTKVKRLTSVGLTNRPNFKVPALNRSNSISRSVNSVLETAGFQNSRQSNSINSKGDTTVSKANLIKSSVAKLRANEQREENKTLKKITAVLNSRKSRNDEEITEEKLVKEAKDVLDLPEDASLNDVIEEIAKTVDEVEELKDAESSTSTNSEGDVQSSILSALDLAEDASLADVIDAIEKLKGGDEGSDTDTETNSKTTKALQSQVKNLTNIINSDRRSALLERRERALNSAIDDGKISVATRKAFELSLNSVEALEIFEKEMENAPSVFAKSIKKPNGHTGYDVVLNSEQKEHCKKYGISEKDFKKRREELSR